MDAQHEIPDLFPRIEPYDQGMLDLDGRHRMYWEQSGNPAGTPVVFLHGGPGAGAATTHRRFFDPAHYRIVVYDQRGAGRSEPHAEIRDNSTQHLIADIEALRRHLGVDRWLVFGGSWGAALALAYGIAHPERCLGFVLRGIFLCRRRELDWFLYGMRTVFPENWRSFAEYIPAAERDDLLAAYFTRLTDPDPAVHIPAARIWCQYEVACSTLMPKVTSVSAESGPGALSLARIEAHYFRNDMFMPEGYLLDNIDRIRHLPAVLVQGRYDMVCPVTSADALARSWPEARFVIVPDAGHSALERGIRSALVDATNGFRGRI